MTAIDKINPHADLAGIEQGGYKLVYKDKPSKGGERAGWLAARVVARMCWFSIGTARGQRWERSRDVRWNGPADKARLAPGEKIIAVNGTDVFERCAEGGDTRGEGKDRADPSDRAGGQSFVSLVDIDYHDGERYPALERVEGTPDYLDEITKPLTTAPAAAPAK